MVLIVKKYGCHQIKTSTATAFLYICDYQMVSFYPAPFNIIRIALSRRGVRPWQQAGYQRQLEVGKGG